MIALERRPLMSSEWGLMTVEIIEAIHAIAAKRQTTEVAGLQLSLLLTSGDKIEVQVPLGAHTVTPPSPIAEPDEGNDDDERGDVMDALMDGPLAALDIAKQLGRKDGGRLRQLLKKMCADGQICLVEKKYQFAD
jgi:hypothetical protein